jgi:acyl carrier protein
MRFMAVKGAEILPAGRAGTAGIGLPENAGTATAAAGCSRIRPEERPPSAATAGMKPGPNEKGSIMPDKPTDGLDRDQSVRQFVQQMLRRLLKVGPETDIAGRSPAELSLNSLGAITLQYQLQADYGVDVTVSEIMEARTVGCLADLAASRLPCPPPDSRPTPESGVLI